MKNKRYNISTLKAHKEWGTFNINPFNNSLIACMDRFMSSAQHTEEDRPGVGSYFSV